MAIRKRGNAWQIVIDVGKKGDRHQKVFTFYGTKPEARAEEARLKAMYKHGTALPGKMTVAEYMIYWLNTYKKRKLAYRTYESYKETIEKHIAEDELGKKPFDRVTPDDIQKYYNRKLDSGLSGTTVLYHHHILHAAYAQAVKARLVPWGMNPCAAVEPPEKNEFEPAKLTNEQMVFIIANTTFEEITDKGKVKRKPAIRLPIIISDTTGARAGECCGLRWPDLDYDLMAVKIHKSIKRENGKLILGPTKNGKERWVPLIPGLKTILEWHKKQQDKVKELYNAVYGEGAYKDEGYILARFDGSPYDPHYLSEYFTKAIIEMDFKGEPSPTFHACRHFYASFMHNQGANDKFISDALGHGGKMNKATEIYVHTQLEAMRPYVKGLDKAILKGVLAEIEGHRKGHKEK